MNSLSPSLSLSDVIHGLRGQVGAWAVRGWVSALLGLLLHRRLGEILGRMERLVARFEAGKLGTVARRRRAEARPTGVRPATSERIWPVQYGWLVRAASWHAAGYGEQLRWVLRKPEMVALLIAAPQAARILRPLCRMLAVETSLLRHPALPGVVADATPEQAPAEKPKRVRKPRAKVDWGRIPIPRGVLSAVRRRGFLKD